MAEIFGDIRAHGDVRSPITVRAFCRKCGLYQTLKATGTYPKQQLTCAGCDSTERYDPVDAVGS